MAYSIQNSNQENFTTCGKINFGIDIILLITAIVIGILAQVRPDLINPSATSNLLISLATFNLINLVVTCCQRRHFNQQLQMELDNAYSRGMQAGQEIPPGQPQVINLNPTEARRTGIHTLQTQPQEKSQVNKHFPGQGHVLGGS